MVGDEERRAGVCKDLGVCALGRRECGRECGEIGTSFGL